MKKHGKNTAATKQKVIDRIAKMLEDGLKVHFKNLVWATKRFEESPHIATGVAKSRAIQEFHEQLAKVSRDIYNTWLAEWYDDIPSEEMSGLIHNASEKVGFDDEHSVFKEGI